MIPCRGRTCGSSWCRKAWARLWRERMLYGASDLMARGLIPYEFTLTAPGVLPDGVSTWADWSTGVARRYAELMRRLSRGGFLIRDPYWTRVRELHRPRGCGREVCGHPAHGFYADRPHHLHVLLFGWVDARADLEAVRALVVASGFGPRFTIKRVRSLEAFVGYVGSGYLLKGHEFMGRHVRVVERSRNWPRDPAEDEWADYRRMVNALDPVVAVLPDGLSWTAWADRAIAAGSGSLVCDSGSAFALVRPPRGSPVLFPEPDGWVDP